MITLIINWLLSALIIIALSYFLPGVHVLNFATALIVALVIGIINVFVKPFLKILTLPLTLITFGLFSFVLNALLMLLVSALVPGFKLDGFFWALVFSIVLAIVNSLIGMARKGAF